MLVEIVGVVVALILVVLATLVLYARWNYGVLEGMGVPVEKPHWLLGNVGNLMGEYCHWEDLRRFKKLGPIYGIYEGRTPMVHIADPKAIYKIFFTESDHFEKRNHDLGDPLLNEAIELLNGEKWKVVHNILSPQFTTGKLKNQSLIIQNICNGYVEHLKEKMNPKGRIEKVDLHQMAAPFIIEVIGEMMCGIKIKDAKDPANQFIKDLKGILFDDFQLDDSYKYILTFPFLAKFSPMVEPAAVKTLRQYLRDVLEVREKSPNGTPDMVSVLLEMRRRCESEDYKRLGITENTVFGQAFEFFSASYLGVVFTTKMLIFHLLKHPETHRKVVEEVETVLSRHGGQVSYEAATEMEYLGACLMETWRISPGFFRPDRVCVKDWTYENLTIPKGTVVAFPIYAIHHNEEIYPQPEKFLPERFLGENKKMEPGTFMTFGQGQRQCLGMRLATQILKIYIATLLKEFKIEKRSDTIWKEAKGNEFFVTLDPIYVDFVKKL